MGKSWDKSSAAPRNDFFARYLSIAPTNEFFVFFFFARRNRRRSSTSTTLKATIPRRLTDGFRNKPLLLTSAFVFANNFFCRKKTNGD